MIQGDSSLLISTYQKNLLEQVRKFDYNFFMKRNYVDPSCLPGIFLYKVVFITIREDSNQSLKNRGKVAEISERIR